MMRHRGSALALLAAATILACVPAVLAHGDETDMEMDMAKTPAPTKPESEYPGTYFSHPDHKAVIYAHIGLMVVAWVFVLPVAVMLSLARSRYTLAIQFLFLATNAIGILLSIIYNASTPDLYPNNAHHKIGWVFTWVMVAQVLLGLLAKVAGVSSRRSAQKVHPSSVGERQSFIPVSRAAMAEHHRQSDAADVYRLSNDSGQGTEPHTESLRSHSSSDSSSDIPLRKAGEHFHEDDDDLEAHLPVASQSGRVRSLVSKVADKLSTRVWRILFFGYDFVDRIILILGFVMLSTGIATFGRFFEGHQIFTGLAHWIKGGVIFWVGVFMLGRWAGSFAELGWAWNARPKGQSQKWRPSAEFAESALIFFYGITNIFLEHLANWGESWSAQDLEHMSITVLFIGGGLLGMLVESTRIRELLNTTVTEAAHSFPDHDYEEEEREALQPPKQYEVAINPIPALVLQLLGIMMSSHHQASMVSSMVHKQWGTLLSAASYARALTTIIMYLKPPKSILPSRPPTELLASFAAICAGIVFMASSGDTVEGMEHYGLDAMFLYTVITGFVGLLMAWIIVVIAIKGWAVRKEAAGRNASYKIA